MGLPCPMQKAKPLGQVQAPRPRKTRPAPGKRVVPPTKLVLPFFLPYV